MDKVTAWILVRATVTSQVLIYHNLVHITSYWMNTGESFVYVTIVLHTASSRLHCLIKVSPWKMISIFAVSPLIISLVSLQGEERRAMSRLDNATSLRASLTRIITQPDHYRDLFKKILRNLSP